MTLSPETGPGDGQPVAGPDVGQADEAHDNEEQRPGLVAQLRGLYDDGRTLIDAEISYQRARISAVGRQVRAMAILAFVGLVLLGCSLIALTVGTMIALIPLIGPWGAMGATVLGSLVLAGGCFWLAAGRIGKVTALFESEPQRESEPKSNDETGTGT